MNNIITRAVWGALFVVIIISSFIVGAYAAAIVLGFFMCIGVFEFYRFFEKSKIVQPKSYSGILGAALIYTLLILKQINLVEFPIELILIPIVFLPFLFVLFSKQKNPLLDLTVTFFPWIYVMLPFYLMFSIYNYGLETEPQWLYIIGLFVLVWTNDTFAYLSGRSFGKNKLFERISPKKTWEGTVGGFLFTIIAGVAYAYFMNGDLIFWIIASVVISPTSVLGDLIESKFKRIVEVKDSGTILPGHGGILDRFDAVIYATPFFYLLLTVLG
ncbi:phosphatidate cytidylyltransferase [Brumimicrobium oceani]|uniref:Phosphatidate cytidylyltransferase n=1 Tax=Brumimicrobium oceani TaxID=2100725 RepID=A0A2U2XE65_9FLAO|nr:phosphatidate cytidylyltransferase [Brumimicrobium oceani]PWH86098.1 phosphatidate cytidylyltransferase [Brumimicrobium oceani]